MSYLKLDRTKINYLSPKKTKSGFILSQVIPSKCSPGSPKLISTTQELDIFFGRSFPEREYFEELLSGDVTLLLTTPKKPDLMEVPVLDLSEFTRVDTVILEGQPLTLYYRDQLPEVGGKGMKYYVSGENTYYVYYQGSWVSESDLPVKHLPGSFINHDTLRLNSPEWSDSEGFPWCWPKYSSEDWIPQYTEDIQNIKDSLLSSIHETKNWDGKSIGFILDFSKVPENSIPPSYLVMPVSGGRKIQFYIGDSGLPPDTLGAVKSVHLTGERGEMIEKILDTITSYGWKYTKKDEGGLIYELFNEDVVSDIEFYTIPGISFKGDINVSHNILSILSESSKRVEFYSKTLGPGDEDIHLEITKIKGKTGWYRFIISRYDYQEVFEGPLHVEYSEDTNTYDSIKKKVNLGSQLVEMKLFEGEGELPEGEFTLSRSSSLDDPWEPDDFFRGLSDLSEFGVSEDFLMIPRMEDFLRVGVKEGKSWYSEYEDLLDYAAEKNCQVLISNHPWYFGCETFDSPEVSRMERPSEPLENHLYLIGGKTAEKWDGKKWIVLAKEGGPRWREVIDTISPGYTGNQIFNYLLKDENGRIVKDLDPDNRLIYFYRDMTYLGWWRPAWYVFLRSISSGNYTPEVNDIIYDSPAQYYTEDLVPLGKYKSNYLSENGHIYYYRQYFSGDSPVTSILSRFIMDKVSGTVSRDFPAYLGKETTGEIIRGLQGILTGLRSRYSMIYSLEIDHIDENIEKQTLSVYLNLGIREALDEDIKLSVTLNFNFA